jgi:beta-N-acetylhexosaminidase
LSSRQTERALILGCSGTVLADEEAALFASGNPLGFILFARNVSDPPQLARLVRDLRRAVGRADAPVLVDQEGGRVQRLRPPAWRAAPPAARFADLHVASPAAAREAARLNARLIAAECMALGIDVVCAPCADVPSPGAHDVIGDRALGRDAATVAELASAAAEGLMDLGVMPVMKHMPGHGRAGADSHRELPVVDASAEELRAVDAAPFRALASTVPWGMTAHVLYRALDAQRPGTISPACIAFIRDEIGFDGLLLSDDLGMNALGGAPIERARAALAAGCDVALHCDGAIETSRVLLSGLPALGGEARRRLEASRRRVRPRLPVDAQVWRGRLDALLAGIPSP